MANLKISQLTQRTPDGQEYIEVIIPPFGPGDNRKVLISDLFSVLAPDGWLVTGTTNLTGDTVIDNGSNNLSIGDTASGPYTYLDMDGSGPVGLADTQISGIGNPLGTNHSFTQNSLGVAENGVVLQSSFTGGGLAGISILSSVGASGVNMNSLGSSQANAFVSEDGRFGIFTNNTERLHIENDGSWDLGPSNDPGTAGYSLTSNGAGSPPTWQDPGAVTVGSITGAVSLGSSDLGKLWLITGTTTAYTVDLPTAVGNDNLTIILKGSSLLTQNVTIAGISGQTIDGESNRIIGGGGSLTLLSDGANWQIVNEVGSWITYTPVWGGFSIDPTVSYSKYFRTGKMCTVVITTSANGTSDATTTTVTLPFATSSTSNIVSDIAITVNSGGATTTGGFLVTRAGQSTVDLFSNHAGAAWGATLGKRVSLVLTFQIL